MEKETNGCACVVCGSEGKSLRVIAGVLLAVLAVYVAVLAANAIKANKYVGRDAVNQGTISVSGEGEVYKAPDLAVMDFSVISTAKTVVEAMADNTKKMNAIIDVAKSLGVAEKDLQTTNFNINPRYDYVKTAPAAVSGAGAARSAISSSVPAMDMAIEIAPDESYYYPNGKRVLSGYDVTQTLTVKMRDMAKIGQIIEELVASGANQTNDLRFTLDDPAAVQGEARKEAINDAKEKARILAEQLGVKLGRITSYNDSGYSPVYRLNYAAKDMAAGAVQESAPAPTIQTGESKITANVNIVYEIE